MKNKRICTTLVLIAFGLLVMPLASALAEEAPVERYVFNIAPKEMQGITMNYPDPLHELHVTALQEAGKDCTACHFDNDETTFMGVSISDETTLNGDARTEFIHNSCVACHVEMEQGPSINSCRTCHSEQYGAETGLERVMR